MANLKGQAHYAGLGSWSPLFFSPQEGGGWPESATKFAPSPSCWASWVDFWLFPSALQKRLRKNIEKSAKIEDFGLPNPSQNPSKILSKPRSQKTCDFWAHFRQHLSKLKASKPWKYQFSLGKITIFKVFAKIVFLLCPCIFNPKILQKNTSKTRSERWKNRCQKCAVF